MEQKDLIFLDTGENDSFVLVERNRKRQKEKQKQILKRGMAIILLFIAIIGAIKLFPYAKDFFKNFGNQPSNNNANLTPGVDENDQSSDTSNEADTSTDKEQSKNPDSTNSDTSSDKNEGNNQNGALSGSDTSTSTGTNNGSGSSSTTDTNTNMNNDSNWEGNVQEKGDYKIVEIGASKYTAINESGCEFDFSLSFSKTALDEIHRKYGSDSPVVLITHSQRNESYSNGQSYSKESPFYSESENVAEIGKIICQRLNAYGISAIQLDELYASGAIFSSQKEYEKSLNEVLNKYPSISYVFNISRGLQINDDFSMDKSYITKSGEKTAQISIITGTSWDTASKDQTENVRFAFDFTKFANKESSGIIKNNTISRYALSQNIGPFCANVEIGEFANSFEEAKLSAELFATLIYKYLSN